MVLTPVRPKHVVRLRELHEAPGIVEWWQLPSADWPLTTDPNPHSFAVLVAGQVAGFAQWYGEGDVEFRRAGMDLFLDPARHGQGLGTEVVRLLCAHLVDGHGYHRLVIDPDAANAAAVACYAKVGFRPVGILRQYGRDRNGVWRDGLLMDLLATELVRS